MSYCENCNRAVAREDRVEVDGAVYHRSCAPDDAVDHRRLGAFIDEDDEEVEDR
jgi:hypothetical protein